jgi:Pentapeptide repeats (8 copies)
LLPSKEAFPRARDILKKQDAQFRPESLDARSIRLDNAYLAKADLKQVFMQRASLQKVDLRMADLSDANLSDAKLSGADLGATKLSRVILNMADLSDAILTEADLSGAHLGSVKLIRADLGGADVSGANLEDAMSLEGSNLRGVNGLTKEQLGICKAKGAIVDEDPTTSSSQSTVSPLPPSQSDDTQASSAPVAQGSTPIPDTGGSNTTSSKLGPES